MLPFMVDQPNMFNKKQAKLDERVRLFHEEYKTLAEKHGLDFVASTKECPTCLGKGQIGQISIQEKKPENK